MGVGVTVVWMWIVRVEVEEVRFAGSTTLKISEFLDLVWCNCCGYISSIVCVGVGGGSAYSFVQLPHPCLKYQKTL